MPKQSATGFMIKFVTDYLDGKKERMDFDLDFNHYLMKHYSEMERENFNIADCFYVYLAEEGFDQAIGLPDAEHKKLIFQQYNEFQVAMCDGFW